MRWLEVGCGEVGGWCGWGVGRLEGDVVGWEE